MPCLWSVHEKQEWPQRIRRAVRRFTHCGEPRLVATSAKEVYKLRKQLVEPVFGIIKEPSGRRFLLRANVAAEWTVLATAFNLRTLWRVWRRLAGGMSLIGQQLV